MTDRKNNPSGEDSLIARYFRPLATDPGAFNLDDDAAIRYIDRFLMYYIQTADRLTRTSVWLEKMEGGIDYLREVIVHDKLGICDELERRCS